MPRINYLHIATAFLFGVYAGLNVSTYSVNHNAIQTSKRNADEVGRLEAAVKKWRKQVEDSKRSHSKLSDIIKQKNEELDKCKASKIKHHETKQQEQTSMLLRNRNENPICQSLPFPTPATSALWNQNIPNILKASQMPNDSRFKFHDFTAEVLQIITPRLHRSVKALPYDWTSLENVMNIGWERYNYLQLPEKQRKSMASPPPRPLKILVMGGSVIVGRNCRKLVSELSAGFTLPNRECTWSQRVGQFINKFFGATDNEKLVEVTKVAMGGTNTATGNIILEYDLIPEEARNPDIIINAYSTNDMHILSILEAQASNTTLRDKVFETTQDFVREVMRHRTTCSESSNGDNNKNHHHLPSPLLLHMDDYLGNEQRTIWETTELSQGVQVLANYYGFTSMSYADVVRDVVYGDTYEWWFSANWWETGSFEREIHPGMAMHLASTWVTAYNLLNLITNYCSMPMPKIFHNVTLYYDSKAVEGENYQKNIELWPVHRHDLQKARGKPQQRPLGIPPVLTKDLLIENVTALWRQNSKSKPRCDPQQQYGVKCPFSWVSGLSLQQNNKTWIEEFFRNQATEWQGWELRDDGGKLGFVPTKVGSRFVLEFDVSQPIRAVTIFFMKSYGSKWEGSRFKAEILEHKNKTWITSQKRVIVGIHSKNTSEMYTEQMRLQEPISVGHKFRLEGQLVGGTTFKLMGLAVCS